ncbi:ABC transporter ATP-binding protein [Roseiarcaceae bacterium H3SJ34-1]|uniref:ABC transporter ATP-binding protein n=1 Tax=Terripilifer ovatus TaxID=3032367 RepID=UPI003AB98BAF|nr:ABC transporter ATP-binding protein [Roseiarcaceae bacterium H3SJ34-1]
MVKPLLQTVELTRRFGAFTAVDRVSFTLPAGARHALIGPNGAGKTTFVNLLSGVLAPSSGELHFEGHCITRTPMHLRARMGLSRTYQITSLFPRLTAREQIVFALLERDDLGWSWLSPYAKRRAQYEEAESLLQLVRLTEEGDIPVRSLPYGKQRLLEIALGLAIHPSLLILDEPAAGIPSDQSAELFEVIAGLSRETAILFIEHDMDIVFRFAERITVLVNGGVFCEGTPADIAADADVRRIYLGDAENV